MHWPVGILADAETLSKGGFWLPPKASTFCRHVDFMYWAIFWISAAFFLLIVGLGLYWVVRYRRIPGVTGNPWHTRNTRLEILWTVVPTLIVAWMFYEGFLGYLDMRNPPMDCVDIKLTCQKWYWTFDYGNGVTGTSNAQPDFPADPLYVPLDEDVRISMISKDVIHSFFVPAFRTKMDVVPGRVHRVWFHAIKEGEYPLLCAEYCGRDHSNMMGTVKVVSRAAYEKMIREGPKAPPGLSAPQRGYMWFNKLGCAQCHSYDGSPRVGPSFKGFFDHAHPTEGGKSYQGDDLKDYVTRSLREPQAEIASGFGSASAMSSFANTRDDQIDDLLAFFKDIEAGLSTKKDAGGKEQPAPKQTQGKPDQENSHAQEKPEPQSREKPDPAAKGADEKAGAKEKADPGTGPAPRR